MTATGGREPACGQADRSGARPSSGRERFPGGADRGALRRVEVLLDPGDVPVPDLQVHGRVQGAPGAVGQRAAEQLLLDHAVLDAEFLSRWLEIRAEAITRIAGEIRRAQAAGFCPGIDPVLTASALSAMLEHF